MRRKKMVNLLHPFCINQKFQKFFKNNYILAWLTACLDKLLK